MEHGSSGVCYKTDLIQIYNNLRLRHSYILQLAAWQSQER